MLLINYYCHDQGKELEQSIFNTDEREMKCFIFFHLIWKFCMKILLWLSLSLYCIPTIFLFGCFLKLWYCQVRIYNSCVCTSCGIFLLSWDDYLKILGLTSVYLEFNVECFINWLGNSYLKWNVVFSKT